MTRGTIGPRVLLFHVWTHGKEVHVGLLYHSQHAALTLYSTAAT